MYELLHKFNDELRLGISRNEGPSRKSLKSLELKVGAGPETQYENIHKKLSIKNLIYLILRICKTYGRFLNCFKFFTLD